MSRRFSMEFKELVSKNEEIWLLKLARNAIQTTLDKNVELLEIQTSLSLSLYQKRGVFVSLWLNTNLRGCIGSPFPDNSLEAEVQNCAIKSAVQDSRFPRLRAAEFPDIEIEISILTPPHPIEVNQIQVGEHGLIVIQGNQFGLLLPRDASEGNWDTITFLEKTCLKGGLSQNAWKEGANLFAFKTQSFKESSP